MAKTMHYGWNEQYKIKIPRQINDKIKNPIFITGLSFLSLLIDKAKNQNIPAAARATISHLTPAGISRTQLFRNVLKKFAIKQIFISFSP